MGWNMSALRPRPAEVHARFRAIFEHHFGQAMRDYGLDDSQVPLEVIVAAVTSYQLGLIVEGLSGVEEGHRALADWIQRWIDDLEAKRPSRHRDGSVPSDRPDRIAPTGSQVVQRRRPVG